MREAKKKLRAAKLKENIKQATLKKNARSKTDKQTKNWRKIYLTQKNSRLNKKTGTDQIRTQDLRHPRHIR